MSSSRKRWSSLHFNDPLSKKIVQSFIFEKETDQLNLILGLIDYRGELASSELLELIGSKLYSYYFDDNIWNEEVNSELQQLHLENSLQKLNSKLTDLINSGEADWNPDLLNVLVATLYQEKQKRDKLDFCLSKIGNKVRAIIYHQLQGDSFKTIDVLGPPEPWAGYNKMKLFSDLIFGQLTAADQVLLCDETLFETVPDSEIKTAITTLPPASALEHLKNKIDQVGFSFAAVTVKVQPLETVSSSKQIVRAPGSVEKLFRTEKETERLLASGLKLTFVKSGIELLKKAQTMMKVRLARLPALTHKIKSRDKIEVGKRLIDKTGSLIKTSLTTSQKITESAKALPIFQSATRQKFLTAGRGYWQTIKFGARKISKKIILTTINGLGQVFRWYRSLSAKHKISLAGAVIFVFVFIQSIVWISYAQKKSRLEKEYRKSVFTIEDKIDRAEAALIFKEDEKALENLNAAKSLLEELPSNTASRKEKRDKLLARVNSKFEQLQRMIKISNPNLIAQLNTNGNRLTLVDNRLVISGDKDLWVVTLGANNELDSFNVGQPEQKWLFAASDSSKAYLFDQNQQMLVYDKERNAFEAAFSPLKRGYQISDMTAYDGRLYLLEKNAPQIYRHGRATGGFSGESFAWLREDPTLLNGVISLAVDGAVYLLRNDGQIIKLFNGTLANPPIKTVKVEQAVLSPTKIYTGADSSHLFVIDPPTKRLLVFSKQGELFAQYVSEQFDELKDVTFDPISKKIYLLNGKKVYQIDFQI